MVEMLPLLTMKAPIHMVKTYFDNKTKVWYQRRTVCTNHRHRDCGSTLFILIGMKLIVHKVWATLIDLLMLSSRLQSDVWHLVPLLRYGRSN